MKLATAIRAKLMGTPSGSAPSDEAWLYFKSDGKLYKKFGATESTVEGGTTTDASLLTSGTLNTQRLPSRLREYAASITDWNLATQNGWYMASDGLNAPGTGWFIGQVLVHNESPGWTIQEVYPFTAAGLLNASDTGRWRRVRQTGTWGSWYRLRDSQAELDARYSLGTHNHDTSYYTKAQSDTRYPSASVIPTKTATERPETYPNGPSTLEVGVDATWPVNYALVETYFYNTNRARQTITEKSTARQFMRTAESGQTSGWSYWVESSLVGHNHDNIYYTKTQTDTTLLGKSNTGHNHDDRYHTEQEMFNLLAGKADVTHAHNPSDVTGLQASLDAKAPTVHYHDDRYYTEAEVDQKISEALSGGSAHLNTSFDDVAMSTQGPGSSSVAARLVPTGWSYFWANGTGVDAPSFSAAQDNLKNPAGYALKVSLPTTGTSGLNVNSNVFPVTPGSLVTFDIWVRGNGPTANFDIKTHASSDPDFFVTGTQISSSPLIIPGPVFQRITHSLIIPAGQTKCRITLRNFATGTGAAGSLWWDESRSSVQIIPPSGVETGEIKMWPTATVPSGYLLCNGGTFSSTTYPVLAALLGDTWGTHTGTTYYLPDFRGRTPIGVGSAVPAAGGNVYTLAQKFGHEKLQSHNHGGATGNGQSNVNNGDAAVREAYYTNTYGLVSGGGYGGRPMVYSNAAEVPHAHTIPSAGTGNAENVSPSLGINFIIKAA